MKELPKAYESQQHEDNIYQAWEQSGYFNPDNLPGERNEAFSIMMPPPNVTGVLHLGHALENTLMDIQARYQRMLGKKVLLLPGTDHAAIATQAKVEDVLKKEGMQNPRQELGREGLLEKIREFANGSQATILNQMKKMGTSADWSRLAYTFDDKRSAAVNEVFIKMFNDGLIYRGYRVINWSVMGQSTASDDEVEHVERTTTLYTFTYSQEVPIPIATVLPETKLGDVAIAVHPEGKWKQYIGQTFEVKNFGSLEAGQGVDLTLQVIGDAEVEEDFGTGALGVTPAHSLTDYEMSQRHKLPLIQVVGQDGNMTARAGHAYDGKPVKQARAEFVEYLRAAGLMIEEVETTHNVTVSDRFKDEIWPMPMEQWFIDVNKEVPGKGKTLKQLMIDAVQNIEIMPERFNKTYLHWVENLRDWNISRQIWWGHRIPVWYKGDEVVASVEAPGEGWHQDEDTLDTWFSSGMWPFSTLGYPEQTEDLNTFFPTAWMQMGHEIIFLWMARMILFSTYTLGDVPFKQVYIHGILRDKEGKKFSKSSGNGIDPLDVIKEFGTDALRLSLIKGITPGNDARFYEEKVVDARNFVNKLWNITRYVLMQDDVMSDGMELSDTERWIESRLHSVITETTQLLNAQQFSQASEVLYNFVWNEFADWYIEISKLQFYPQHARHVLKQVLKLLHPYTPFITEVLWHELGEKDMLMVSEWPIADSKKINPALERDFSRIQDLVIAVRNVRAQYKIPYSQTFTVFSESLLTSEIKDIVEKMCKVDFQLGVAPSPATQIVAGINILSVCLTGLIDMDAERSRLQKEITQLEKQVAGFTGKLGNASYVDNAPTEVVAETRTKLAEAEAELKVLQETLRSLKN